ncbi:MAG: glutamine--fructose-6-phosphate transaminase (isomerizing) [Spirochaetes bacterium]|nr:glutamine--fructose-6-phosphate transaminase (isomerizing) [Spirochaetota bacterium]
MCGIVGYIGEKNCVNILVEGLKRLEYRGYDSSGIAVIYRNSLKIFKKAGKIIQMESSLPDNLNSKIGIAHTRWATHGEANDINAHPHLSQNNKFSIVHNGIIENYSVLKKKLEAEGYKFKTQTDSEVIAYLIEKNYKDDFEEAFYKALEKLEGAYGIVALCEDNPDFLMVARKGSPLILGVGNDEMFVASDVSAFLGHTKQVVYLDDYEITKIEKNNFKIKDFRLSDIARDVKLLDLDTSASDKGDYSHFMLKEIFEQPESIKRAFAGRLIENFGTAKLGGLNLTPQDLFQIERVGIYACGTSYHAGLVGSYILEELARISAYVEISSEARYKNPLIEKGTIFFAISQSGETADTLFAMREAQRKGAKVLGICNVVVSTIARESNGGVYVHSGPEIAVASTKAFTSQITVLFLYALLMGRMRDVSLQTGKKLINELKMLPEKIQTILNSVDKIDEIAVKYSKLNNYLFLGRGISYPVALEGALKLKEISYRHSEGIAAGEIKHGPIALVDEETPVIFIVPQDNTYDKTISNIEEVKARKGKIISVCFENDQKVKALSDDYIEIPETNSFLSPLLTVIPLQLFAYYTARALGCDIDKPRNLAKSVTVE